MNQSQKNLVRMVALLDVVIAIVLAALVVFGTISIPLLVPILLAISGIVIIGITFVLG